MSSPSFFIELTVRDYECDMQGIVNNAIYLHYLEHARHEYLKYKGLNFAELTRDGIILVVKRSEIDYHHPLRSGDSFRVGCLIERVSPLRFAFVQQIYRLPDLRSILSARIIGTSVNRSGRPFLPDKIDLAFE
ncbi:MAG: thioesterase family protein [Bacteroidales bacterium]|jgi:acyl-CoA thioester hydrolase|nr:acyl-CoA thioesterase [Bacteroidales bacterium]MDD3700083.1 thioesterase family protein [Bacteroidales bacterium]MDY0369093.1 thioesterase family protein [Bacteroidales bacterium]